MVDNLLRLREPAAWVVVLATLASIVLALVRFGVALSTGAGLAEASQGISLAAMNLTFVVLVVGVVWACVFVAPAVPRAKPLALLAAITVTLGTLLTLVGAVIGVTTTSGGALGIVLELLGGLLDIVVKGVGAVTLWLIHRGLRAGRLQPEEPPRVPDEVEPAPEPPRAPTTWTPDAAAGSVWISASDAASGAPASGFGLPGEAGEWRPVERPSPQAHPDSPPRES